MPVTSPRQSTPAYPVPQTDYYGDWEQLLQEGNTRAVMRAMVDWNRSIASVVKGLSQGKLNATGTVTLTANQATTTLSSPLIGRQTKIHLFPTTANAAAEFGSGTVYMTYPNATEGQAVINHANDANADKAFTWVAFG